MTDEQSPPPGGKPSLSVLTNELDEKIAGAHGNEPPPDGDYDQDGRGSGPPSSRGADDRMPGEIYPGSPVTALGVSGKFFFYLDALGQLQAVDTHTKDRMRGIFGVHAANLHRYFAQYDKSGKVSGWKQEDLATNMVSACSEKGVWNMADRVRGLGAWPDDDGGVVMHCGQRILSKGQWYRPAQIDEHVYPSFAAIAEPLKKAKTVDDEDPGTMVLEALRTWSWRRRDTDAYLLFGWICCALFGGALSWRPLVWITGDAGTGKSTMQDLVYQILGGDGGGVLKTEDTTEAGLRQRIGQSTVPVLLDEIEAEADPRKVKSVVKLARLAASGGMVFRGGADHQGTSFTSRNCFMFSSILVTSLLDQDISRIALLELQDLTRGVVPPDPSQARWGRAGQALRTRILAQWPRLHETLTHYRAALAAVGHSARGCDQYGALLALADLAMHDEADRDRCDDWAENLTAEMVDEQSDRQTDWQRMLNHLFSQAVDVYRGGEKMTIGAYVRIACGLDRDDGITMGTAERALSFYGMRIARKPGGTPAQASLLIANQNAQLGKLFENTQWHAGAGQTGVWVQAVKRIPGATTAGVKSFSMAQSRAHQVPLASIPGALGDEPPSAPSEPAQSSEIPEELA